MDKIILMLAAVILFLALSASSQDTESNFEGDLEGDLKGDLEGDLEDTSEEDYQSNPSGFIVGGTFISIEEVPWQVSLVMSGALHFCGGSIVSARFIVTAAHCLDGMKNLHILVHSGATNLDIGGTWSKVKTLTVHEKYAEGIADYDIGLIELTDPLKFGPHQKAIELARPNEPLVEGTLIHITGWGETSYGSIGSDILQEAYIPIYNQEKCKDANAETGLVTKLMFCAGFSEGGKDSCQGDSGGPAVMNETLVGVISWGHGCAEPGHPGVYTRVSAFRDWLDEHIA